MLRKLGFAGCSLALSMALGSEPFPQTASDSLAGHTVLLPDSLKGHPTVVIIGFSKGSQNAVKEWDARARKELGETLPVYEVAVLEDAPRFVRGMITHGMKGSVPAVRQDFFLVVVKGEAELKKAAGFSATDDAYVFVLDGAGEICWRTHGKVSDTGLTALAEQAKKLR